MAVCGECGGYSDNMRGCYTPGVCHADMMDSECTEWFRRLEPTHECHRPCDFKESRNGYDERGAA